MNLPIQVTFRHMDPSPAVEERILEEAGKLDQYFDRITSCRVVVESPHHHHEHGRLYHIRIELGVPGKEIIVKHEPSLRSTLAQSETGTWEKHREVHPEHRDIYVAIRDAFLAARRQLDEYAHRLRGEVKRHSQPEAPEGAE